MTGRGHPPLVPIGHVDVDAYEGELLPDDSQAEKLMLNAKVLTGSVLSPE